MNNSIFDVGFKPPKYYSGARREMLDFIPSGSSRILDVGCGQGEFARLVKSERHAEVWGVEIHREAAERAVAKIDRVLIGDIERDDLGLPNGYFDCVIFNDILEHLRDPWMVLQKVRAILTPGGYVVASIPNVRYFDHMKALLKHKEWRYETAGILDWTHLRFFTINSIRELFEYCGYEVVSIDGINGRKFPWKFRMLNYILKGTFEDMRYQQFACVAQRKSNP